MRRAGLALLALVALGACGAPWVAPPAPAASWREHVFAPPMPVRVLHEGRPHRPFVYPLRLVDRLTREYAEDRARPVSLALFTRGRLVTTAEADVPWFALGTDSLGRDVLSRILHGARLSLGVALLAVAGALGLGALLGSVAGLLGGWVDLVAMRVAELIVVLPVLYVVLALRAALPLVLPAPTLFVLLAVVLALAGWPQVARGVRAIAAVEATRDYVLAARAAGATRWRVLTRHLVPAAAPFLATQALLLTPAFVLAEATMSFVGLGFSPPLSSWGSMLQEAASLRAIADTPWVLAPAGALVLVTLGLNLVMEREG
jgi:peptide/nickel transport system permease protein